MQIESDTDAAKPGQADELAARAEGRLLPICPVLLAGRRDSKRTVDAAGGAEGEVVLKKQRVQLSHVLTMLSIP